MFKILKASLIFSILSLILTVTSSNLQNSDVRFTSNRFEQLETDQDQINQYNGDLTDFVIVAENEHLALYVNPHGLAIKIIDLNTGYIWSSTVDGMENHRLNETWRNFVASAITIDYIIGDENPQRESILSGNADVDLSLIADGFIADITMGRSGIQLQLSVTIDESDLIIFVYNDSIIEPENVKLMSLQLYPFLGSTHHNDVSGYMFIPDGAGALIRLDQPGVSMDSPFRAPIFGDDIGVTTRPQSQTNAPHVVRMPIFGIIHGVGQNGFITMIESGGLYGEIFAQTAGLSTDFNWITAVFHYRQTFNQPTTRDVARGPQIQKIQMERNNFDIEIRHRFLSGLNADYVGMALAYQDRLVDLGILTPSKDEPALIRLEFLGAEKREGLLWNSVVAMTPVLEIQGMVENLLQQNLKNLLVVYRGFARGGVSNSFPYRSHFESRLGSSSDVVNTIEFLENYNIDIYFNTDFTRIDRGANRLFGGPRVAQQINTRQFSENFLVPSDVLNQVSSDITRFSNLGVNRLSISTTPSVIYSTFNQSSIASRSENAYINNQLFDILKENNLNPSAMVEPNVLFWQHLDHFFDIPMTSSGYLFATDTVPFLQIVLRGHISYYTPVINFAANSRQAILNAIDFGAYPSFLLTKEPSHLLADTPSRDIFTSEFSVWEETIIETYRLIYEALGQVRNERIVSRTTLENGVIQTNYENGISIIVNYTNSRFLGEGFNVEAQDFAIWRWN